MASEIDNIRSANLHDLSQELDLVTDESSEADVSGPDPVQLAQAGNAAQPAESAMGVEEEEENGPESSGAEPQVIVLTPNADGEVELPEGISLENASIEVDENGDLIIIYNGQVIRIDI